MGVCQCIESHCLCTKRALTDAARPGRATMLRTTLVSRPNEFALQHINGKSAARPRNSQRLHCWSINRSSRLAVARTSASTRKRLSYTDVTRQTTQSHHRGSHLSDGTHSISSQRTAGSGKQRHHSTVCQASRASMMDSLEEVRPGHLLF